MHYVKHFNINGIETKQVACIELHGKPNAATEGAIGALAIDVDSPQRDVYKCVAVNGSIYTWDLLSIDVNDMGLVQDSETGYVYPTYRGVRSANGIPLAASGGGGGGHTNNALLVVTNTTGWITKTIAKGSDCVISLKWSSLENGMPTGNGIATVSVGGEIGRAHV